jgi:hypothetical protein
VDRIETVFINGDIGVVGDQAKVAADIQANTKPARALLLMLLPLLPPIMIAILPPTWIVLACQ